MRSKNLKDLKALGRAHSCTILDVGSLKCWGFNSWGELGDSLLITEFIKEVSPLLPNPCHYQDYERSTCNRIASWATLPVLGNGTG